MSPDPSISSDALRESEERYRSLLEIAPVVILCLDREHRITEWNAEAERVSGYRREEVLGRDYFELFLPQEFWPVVAADIEKVLAGTPTRDFHDDFRARDGSRRPFLWNVTRRVDGDGNALGIVAVGQDVSAMRAAEAGLRQSEELQRLVLEASGAGIWEWDFASDELTWSPRVYEMLRLEPSVRLTRDALRELVHPEDRALFTANHRRHVEDGEPYDVELRYRRGDGTYGDFHVRGKTLRGGGGRAVRLVGSITDITQRKEVERARVRAERLYRRLSESQIVGIIVSRRDGSVIEANDAFLRMVGHTREDLIAGRVRWRELTPPEWMEVSDRAYEEVRVRGECTPFEKEYLRADGTRVPVRVGATALEGEGETTSVAYIVDLSEQKRALRELQAAKESAEEANRSKDHFLAILSHELRTPLTPVLLFTSALQENERLDEETRADVAMIREQIELEARLIDELLDLTRIQRGKLMLNPKELDAHEVLRSVVGLHAREAAADGIRVEMELSAGRSMVRADAGRLQQVFSNLVGNAVKFSPSGGHVWVRSSNEGGTLVVEVRDTGIGIDPEVMPHVFDAFHQGERTITRRFGGLGLGLTIGKALVEMHGGTIEAESEGTGRGATLRVRLPALPHGQGGDGAARKAAPAGEPARRQRVLVVEDHAPTLAVLRRLLSEMGHEVVTADSVASGERAATIGDFDLLVSDIGLPDGTGLQLLEKLKARGWDLPAVALSGYGTDEDMRRSREAGFLAHIVKPIDLAKLQAVLDGVWG